MSTQRTTGMTTVGILNIVLGALGTLGGLAAFVGGGLAATFGAVASSHSDPTAQQAGSALAAGGSMMMLTGLGMLGCYALMAVSGLGVMKMTPWARKFALISAFGCLALTLISFATTGFSFSLMSIATIAYCGALIYLFMTPPWKAAFSKSSSSDSTMTPSADRYRHAA